MMAVLFGQTDPSWYALAAGPEKLVIFRASLISGLQKMILKVNGGFANRNAVSFIGGIGIASEILEYGIIEFS